MNDFKNCLIFEVYKGSKLTQLNESQANVPEGMMRVTGVAAVIGIQNRNGRIYNKENYLKHIELLQPDIADGLFGELEHPEGFTINNNHISHKIEAVWFDPSTNEVKITLLLLDTEKGKIAQSIIRAGGSLRVSSRAMGSVNKNHEAIIEKLVTYDIVGTPGFKETSLHLSEQMQLISKDSLCESYCLFAPTIVNESVTDNNQQNVSHKNVKTMANNNNLTLLEQALEQRKQSQALNEGNQNASKPGLSESIVQGVHKFLREYYTPSVEKWLLNECFPLFETYLKRKAINESVGKSACSFGSFIAMTVAEKARLNESQEPENGELVLSEQEQQVMQKCMQGQKLDKDEQKLFQQAQQKLQQQQQKLQEQAEPENGELVLSEEEQQAIQKLQEGQQLSNDELKQAGQAVQKLQQQQKEQQQEGQQQKDDNGQEDKEQLRESLNQKYNRINGMLTESFNRLLESSDKQDQDKINQEIDDLKQELSDVQEQIDGLSEGQQQSAAMQKCMQKLQQEEELKPEDLEELTQDELETILDKQKQQNEGAQNYDDPKDAKVFEQDEKPLPSEEELKESLIGKNAGKVLQQSSTLLESLSKRMQSVLNEGKNG